MPVSTSIKRPLRAADVPAEVWYVGTDREIRGRALSDVGGTAKVGVGMMELPPGSDTKPGIGTPTKRSTCMRCPVPPCYTSGQSNTSCRRALTSASRRLSLYLIISRTRGQSPLSTSLLARGLQMTKSLIQVMRSNPSFHLTCARFCLSFAYGRLHMVVCR